jgi:hypothetical protein
MRGLLVMGCEDAVGWKKQWIPTKSPDHLAREGTGCWDRDILLLNGGVAGWTSPLTPRFSSKRQSRRALLYWTHKTPSEAM